MAAKLVAKTANEILDREYESGTPLISGLLGNGLTLLAGDPKIGKSWMMMQIAYHVASGKDLWGRNVSKGNVLYLALEDTEDRLQHRLNDMFGVGDIDGISFVTQSVKLGDGLGVALALYLQEFINTKLVIIDTLQKVKKVGNEAYSYAADYEVMTQLKGIADLHNVAILLVHHTRKMKSENCFDSVSGTNALMGAADAAWILSKKNRLTNIANLSVVGRDLPDVDIELKFNRTTFYWEYLKSISTFLEALEEPIIPAIINVMKNTPDDKWEGTATQLLALLPPELQEKFIPNTITRKLNVLKSELLNKHNIFVKTQRNAESRFVTITRVSKE
jgi:archaellum biogenesis ATPase FlaH